MKKIVVFSLITLFVIVSFGSIDAMKMRDQRGLPIILQNAFDLPENASPHMVDECYKKYLKEYQERSTNLIARMQKENIPFETLKLCADEGISVIEAYKEYKQKRGVS